jgi:glycosyltransferase involved in cell wall biosynthesis
MRIGIDARLLTYRRGMGNFVYNLVTHLAYLPNQHEFIIYSGDPSARTALPPHPRFHFVLVRPKFYPFWEQVLLPHRARVDHLDVLHCPCNTAPYFLPSFTRLVLTVHDAMFFLPKGILPRPPSLYQRLGRAYYRVAVSRVVPRVAALTTVSNYSRLEIAKWLHFDPSRIEVVSEAPGPEFRRLPSESCSLRSRFGLSGRLLLHLAATDPRKNSARVLDAFRLFSHDSTDEFRLVLAGLSPSGRTYFADRAQALGLSASVTTLPYLTQDELVELYNIAEVALYPSLYEGFGLPVLEAMACGTPVITSRIASLPEIAGDAAMLVDPTDVHSLVAAMHTLCRDEALRRSLTELGRRRAALFSWQRTASAMLAVYDKQGPQ